MRNAFAKTLLEVARADSRIWLVCGDLGYSVLDEFAKELPRQFLNAGVAEQNMIGVAAGLALSGKIPFVYSIVNFPVMRCLEQVRNDVAYHRLNVKIVAVGGGLVYGGHGYTHHGAEDLAAMRLMPHMTVVAPGDPVEARLSVPALVARPGPAYLRLGKGGESTFHSTPPDFAIGRLLPLRSGRDLLIAATGAVLDLATQSATKLSEVGISCGIVSVPSLSPFDSEGLLQLAAESGRVLTIEEHGWGGLGTAVAEAIALAGAPIRWRPVRLNREPVEVAGGHAYLRAHHGLDVDRIVALAREFVA